MKKTDSHRKDQNKVEEYNANPMQFMYNFRNCFKNRLICFQIPEMHFGFHMFLRKISRQDHSN